MNETNKPTGQEAKEALASIETMESAGYRRAVPERWFGAGIATLIASMFAIYALEDPYPYIVFPIIGLALLVGSLVGLVVFWLSESERRSYLAKAGGGQAK